MKIAPTDHTDHIAHTDTIIGIDAGTVDFAATTLSLLHT